MFGRVIELRIFTQTELITIDDMQITFNVKLNNDSKDNKANIQVFNINPDTAKRINEQADIELVAGYKDSDSAIIFRGNISECYNDSPKADRPFTITSSDGIKFRDKINYKCVYSGEIAVSQIINDLLPDIGYNIYQKLSEIQFEDKKFMSGFSYNGTSLSLLKKMLTAIKLKYTITNNELKIFNPDVEETSVAIDINENTSFLSAKKIYIKDVDGKTKPGWEVKTQLQQTAFPRNKVNLFFKELDVPKVYTINSVDHIGSYEDGEFISIMKVV